jgi:Kazal-type serine protease inhibitor domain
VKKFIGLWVSILALSTNCLANETMGLMRAELNTASCPEERPSICTREYKPVCGLDQNNEQKTYSNACTACSNKQVISYAANACPEHVLSADELTKLFSGNTYDALIPSRKLKMTVYVDPDGSMRGMQSGHKFTSKWAVNNKGEICVSYKNKMSCRLVMEQDGVYKKIKLNDKGEKVVLVVYKSFAIGNIHNY